VPAFGVQLLRPPLLGALLLGAVACGGQDSHRESAAGASGEGGGVSDGHAGAPAAGSPGLGGAAAGAAGRETGGTGASTCHELEPEPNDTLVDAIPRETLTDCDDSGTTATGTLAGEDVDVWRFEGQDTLGCSVNPTATSDDLLRLCLSAACNSSEGSVYCEQGYPAGDACCSVNGVVSLSLDCDGVSDDAVLWLTVEPDWTVPTSDRDCDDYSVSVHF
jgi:hypothetical protein